MNHYDPELALAQVKEYQAKLEQAMAEAGLKHLGKVEYKGQEYKIISAHLHAGGTLTVELGDGKQARYIVPAALVKAKGG